MGTYKNGVLSSLSTIDLDRLAPQFTIIMPDITTQAAVARGERLRQEVAQLSQQPRNQKFELISMSGWSRFIPRTEPAALSYFAGLMRHSTVRSVPAETELCSRHPNPQAWIMR
jgi:hypothetical protein